MNELKQIVEAAGRWSQPKRVNTKYGPRLLRESVATDELSRLWRERKQDLKALGISWSLDPRYGLWAVYWWQPLPEEEIQKQRQAIEMSRATDAEIEVPAPKGLSYLPYQRAGIRFMLERRGVLLADEMGLGKTVQVIGLINALPEEETKRVLVICPASLKLNWRNELRRWLVKRLSVVVLHSGDIYCPRDYEVVVVNYDILNRFPVLWDITWDVLAVDEAHYLKNPNAQRTKLVLGSKKGGMRPLAAKRRIFMTGTPILNRPVEMFPILNSLEPGRWGWKQMIRYCNGHHNGWGWDFSGASNLEELQERLRSGVMIRRLKKDVLKDLPPKRRQVVEVEPDTESQVRAIEHEKEIVRKHEAEIDEARAACLAAQLDDDEEKYREAVERLRYACRLAFTEMAAAAHEVAREKVPHVVAFIESLLEQTGKVVVFAHHNDVIDEYVSRLTKAGYQVLSITGATPPDRRVEIVRRFNEEPDMRVLVLSIRAAGVGLSVKAAVEVFGELDWTPGVMTQAEDRGHGVGRGVEGEPLMIYHLVMDGSIDARRAKVLVEKQDIADRALDRERPESEQDAQDPAVLVGEESETERQVRAVAKSKQSPPVPSHIKELIHRSLQVLAAYDKDGARVVNGVGFNKIDTGFGRRLAMLPVLTDRQAYAAALMLRKYTKQLGEDADAIRRWLESTVHSVAA